MDRVLDHFQLFVTSFVVEVRRLLNAMYVL